MKKYIDLRSDTVTQPTPEMRKAMAEAVVGDDVYGDDPTVIELEKLAADMLGKEAALFVPTGTMGNQIALMVHTRRGDEIILGRRSHVMVYEQGGAALLSGLSLYPLDSDDNIMKADAVKAAIRDHTNLHFPRTGLICLENALTTGKVVPLADMDAVYNVAKEHGIPVHMDGARVFNAALSLGVDVKELTARCDSLMACLSKGLCAPVGSVLAGTKEFIDSARRIRKVLGGGMRQAGVLAAAGIIALTQMIKRLSEDHDNAKLLVSELSKIPGLRPTYETTDINMAFITFDYPKEVVESLAPKLLEKGIKSGNMISSDTVRFATNNDVTSEDIMYVAKCIREVLA